MTELELRAISQMIDGQTDALAEILLIENPDLHPLVQRHIWKLLQGRKEDSDYRLVRKQHPDLKSRTEGARYQRSVQTREIATAVKMVRYGALKEGQVEAAAIDVRNETGQDRATIMRHWGRHNRFVRMCIARGIIEQPDKN